MSSEKFECNFPEGVHPKVAKHFQGYPSERLWYLLFDYNRRDMGPAGFDRKPSSLQKGENDEHEQGYMSSMFAGFDYVLETIDIPLSQEYLRGLHDAAVSKVIEEMPAYDYDSKTKKLVLNKEKKEIAPKHEKGYRDGYYPVLVGLRIEGERKNVTLDGLRELRNRIRNGDAYFGLAFKDEYYPNMPLEKLKELNKEEISDEALYERMCAGEDIYVVRFERGQKVILDRLDTIIKDFIMFMNTPGISEDDKIRSIAKCVQDILLTHPFSDGNGRTVSLLFNPSSGFMGDTHSSGATTPRH